MQDQYSRPLSEVSIAAPAGWFSKQSWTVMAPDGQANVIASSEPLDPEIDTARYAEIQGSLLRREFPQLNEHWFGEVVIGRRRALLRDFEWTPPDGVRVRQLQVYAALTGQGFTATATTPATNFPRVEELLRGTLSRLRFGPWVSNAEWQAGE